MGLLRQLAHRLLSEERDLEFGYFDYVAAQKRVEQMSMVNEDIQSLEDIHSNHGNLLKPEVF